MLRKGKKSRPAVPILSSSGGECLPIEPREESTAMCPAGSPRVWLSRVAASDSKLDSTHQCLLRRTRCRARRGAEPGRLVVEQDANVSARVPVDTAGERS